MRSPARILTLAALLMTSWTGHILGGPPAIKTKTPHSVTLQIPGGTTTLSLTKAWGRTREPNKNWTAESDKLTILSVTEGKGWVELSLPGRVSRDSFIEIYRFDLDLSKAKGWQDADGQRTWLRHGTWKKTSQLPGKPTTIRAWPAAPGLSRLRLKRTSGHAMGRQDVWTGFSKETFSGGELRTADASAIVRTGDDGWVLGLVANRAIAVSYEGPNKMTISGVMRDLKSGEPRRLRIRLYLRKGKVDSLAQTWATEMDTTPLRVFFAGDSVGAAKGSYTAMLASRLHKTFGQSIRSLNTSRGGDTTAGALKEYQANILDYNPQIVVFQLCYNDVGKIKPQDVAANLKKMIDPLMARPGGRALVLTPLSYDKKRVDETLKKNVDINKVHTEEYIPALKTLIAEYEANAKTKGRVGFANIWQAMADVRKEKGPDHVLLPDGSHPVEEGFTIIADCAWPELKRLVKSALKEVK